MIEKFFVHEVGHGSGMEESNLEIGVFALSYVEYGAFNETSPQSYRMSLSIWDHTVLPATRHKWTHLDLPTPKG